MKELQGHHVSQVEKLQKDYTAVFGNAPRGRSCNSEAWLKDQMEQRIALLKVKKGNKGEKGEKGDKGNDGNDGVAGLDEEKEQYTGKLKDRKAKADAAIGPEKKSYNRAVTLTKQVNGMKSERSRYSA